MTKLVRWTPEGLEFWWRGRNGRGECVAKAPFERGPLGAYAGIVGSPAWKQRNDWSEAWVRRGQIPSPQYLQTGT